MEPADRSPESARAALADFASLALHLGRAAAVRLETEEGSLALGGPEAGSPQEQALGGHGRLLVFGGTSGVSLEPLVRRIVAHLEARRTSLARDEDQANALANAERANEIARSAARRYEVLFEGLPVACYACDVEGRLVEWNRAAEEIWGAAIAMAWGQDAATVVDPDHPEAERAVLARALAGETVGNEEREVRVGEDGPRWHLVSMLPLRDGTGTVIGAIGARLDVTHRRTAQREMAERESRF